LQVAVVLVLTGQAVVALVDCVQLLLQLVAVEV
jgi:hypothetical protein